MGENAGMTGTSFEYNPLCYRQPLMLLLVPRFDKI
jgi:hypothetical protein